MRNNLLHLPKGAIARVVEVMGHGPISLRLLEMGIIPGTMVEVLRTSPFGGAIELKIFHNNVVLRKSEAARVFIELV